MSRTILANDRDIHRYPCNRGDCIWLDADDVDVVFKEMNDVDNSGKVTIRLKNGFDYKMHYIGITTDQLEVEYQRYITQICENMTKTAKSKFLET